MADSNFKIWYKKHKAEFNSKRRALYNTMPDYRKKQLEYVRKNRLKNKQEKTHFFIGELAKFCNCSVKQIKVLESKYWIPLIANDVGYRIYTKHQMLLVKGLVEALELKNPKMLAYAKQALFDYWMD